MFDILVFVDVINDCVDLLQVCCEEDVDYIVGFDGQFVVICVECVCCVVWQC